MAKRSKSAQRAKLPLKYFACPVRAPGSGSYPLDTPERVSSAKAYYGRPNTAKCKGGRKRICRRAKKVGFLNRDYSGYRGWRKFCARA